MSTIARFSLVALLFLTPLCGAFADEKNEAAPDSVAAPTTRTVYLELTGKVNTMSETFMVTINCGRTFMSQSGLSADQLQKAFGNKRYPSMVDAMNDLSKYGWRLEQSYTLNMRTQTVVYWVVSKDVCKPADILEGFEQTTKQ